MFAFSRKFSWLLRIGILFPTHWDETKYFINCNFWSLDPLELYEIMHAVFSIVSWILFLSECCTSPVLILGSVVQKRLEDFQKVLFSDGRIHSLFRNLPFPHTFVLVPPLDSAIFHTSRREVISLLLPQQPAATMTSLPTRVSLVDSTSPSWSIIIDIGLICIGSCSSRLTAVKLILSSGFLDCQIHPARH